MQIVGLGWLALSSVLQMVGPSFYSIVYSLGTLSRADRAPHIEADATRDLRIVGADSECDPEGYVARVNQGLALLRPLVPFIHEGLFVVDFTDPFTFSLQLPPAAHDVLWWDARGTTFSDDNFPDPKAFLDHVDVVMTPQCPEDRRARDTAMRVYGPWLSRHFAQVQSSESWVVLQRRPGV